MADDATFWIDRWGAPVRIDNALHQTTVLKRNAASATPALVVYDSSFDAGVTSLTYNARGNLTIDSTRYVGDALGVRTTVWRYTAANAPDSPDLVTDPAGFQTAYSYDTQGLTTLVWAPNLHKTTYQYLGSTDSLHGLLSAVVDSFVPTWKDSIKVNAHLKTQFTFDLLGNVIKTVSPSGRIDSMGRDTLERVVNAYDGAGHRTEYAYDPANRIRSVKVHVEQAGIRNPAAYPADSGAVAALETKYYFTLGLLDSVSDPRQVPRGFRYDPAGRTIKQIGEAHDTVFTWYNPAGQTDSVRLRTGAKIRNVWDTAGRLVASKFPYDATHKDSTAYGYDAANRVITIRRMRTGDTTSIRRTWYPTGQMQSELDSIGITTMTQTAVYNAAGYRTQLIVSRDGSRATTDSIGYTYADASGNPTGIRVHWRNSATDADSVDNVQLTWDPLGRRDQVLFPLINDTVFFAYDSNSIQRVVCSNGGGGYLNGVMYQQNVDLDGLINQTKSVIPNKGLGRHCAGSWSEVADSATYDVRHQMLVQRAYSQPVIDYRYDGSGNRTREWARGTGYQEPRRDEVMAANSNRLLSASRHDASNVLITNNYYYNLDGSRRQDDECNPGGCAAIQLFQYDSLGRAALMADLGGALGTCSYDPLGRIAVSCDATASGKRMGLTYDGNSVVRASQPIDNQAVAGWSFVHGPGADDPLLGYAAWTTGHVHVYYVTDGQGRQLAVATKAGLNATTVGTYVSYGGTYSGGATSAYTFGVARPISTASATGVSYFRNRMYDQATGRFTQEDPSGIAGGVNLYQYSGNSPANFSDPFGLCPPWPDCLAQGLADWGAKQGGATGAIALNGAAALGAGFEAFGINDAASGGEALGHGELKAAAGYLALTFGGELFKGAKLLKNLHGGSAAVEDVLRGAEKWLGEGYREIDNGVFRSADGARQFRMTASDLGHKTPHVHFEAIGQDGKQIVENSHVYLTDN